MHRLFRPLRKLQWQLSLSYVLVVVVAVPILLGASLALVALASSLPPAQQLAQLNATETLAVVVIDPAGRLAGSDPVMPSNSATGDPASLAFFFQKIRINLPESQQIIQAAFANEQDLAKLVSTQLNGQTLAAV